MNKFCLNSCIPTDSQVTTVQATVKHNGTTVPSATELSKFSQQVKVDSKSCQPIKTVRHNGKRGNPKLIMF